jgi:hypothetical protein
MKCLVCEDTGWVCENHPDQPFTGPHACTAEALVHRARPAIGRRPTNHRDCRRASSRKRIADVCNLYIITTPRSDPRVVSQGEPTSASSCRCRACLGLSGPIIRNPAADAAA